MSCLSKRSLDLYLPTVRSRHFFFEALWGSRLQQGDESVKTLRKSYRNGGCLYGVNQNPSFDDRCFDVSLFIPRVWISHIARGVFFFFFMKKKKRKKTLKWIAVCSMKVKRPQVYRIWQIKQTHASGCHHVLQPNSRNQTVSIKPMNQRCNIVMAKGGGGGFSSGSWHLISNISSSRNKVPFVPAKCFI